MSYWTVPPQAMDSPAEMLPWARLALDAALRAQASRRPAARREAGGQGGDQAAKAAARKGARSRP